MKNIILVILATLVFGCKVQSDNSTSDTESQGAAELVQDEAPTEFAVVNSVQKQDSLFARIAKGACFGNCPTYRMHIYTTGTAVLKAVRGIEKKGLYKSLLTHEQMNEFLLKAKEIRYTEMNDVYDNKSVTDLPMVATSIVIDGERKEVKRRYEYPKEILELEKLFDNLLDKIIWEKIQDDSDN